MTVDEIRALARSLTPAMRHAVLRCSDAGDWLRGDDTTWPRAWPDVIFGFPHATYRGTVCALERRGIVHINERNQVSLTRTGIRVQASLRLGD